MALRFEPSRFFLKGKVTQTSYKQATNINTLQERKLVRCEMNTKEEDRKSRVIIISSKFVLFCDIACWWVHAVLLKNNKVKCN